jgi:hypothetical protein
MLHNRSIFLVELEADLKFHAVPVPMALAIALVFIVYKKEN